MDSTEAANIANIKTARLTMWLVILTVVLVVIAVVTLWFVAWPLLYPPDPSQPPLTSQGGTFMLKGWAPIIVLSSSLLLTIILQLTVALRWLQNKRLTGEIANLKAGLVSEIEKGTQALADARDSKKDAKQADLRANQETNQRIEFTRLYNEAERQLADLVWLRQLAEEQGKNISEHVVITAVKPGNLILSKGRYPLCVTVAFRVRNESVFDITINPKAITGHFSFNGQLLEEAAGQLLDEDRTPIEDLKPNKAETLVLKQPLLKSEAEFINGLHGNDKARFWLGNLSIPISVTASSIQVQDLRINSKVEYVYLGDFDALTLDEHAMTPQELIKDIDALPRTERMKVYKEALKSYVASLVRLHEAEQDRDPESPD